MTFPISEQPSQWHRLPRQSKLLMSDATIDPFPYNTARASSLLDRHRIRNPSLDVHPPPDAGRRNTVPILLSNISTTSLTSEAGKSVKQSSTDLPSAWSTRKRSAMVMAEDEQSRSSSPTSTTEPVEGAGQFCLCQPEPKIPRPRNAFILYRQHQQASVVHRNPGLPNPAISKIIGEQWSRLPEEAKGEWKSLAEEEKARHAQQYPDYRYQPRRSGRYSSQSSTSGPLAGGKSDSQGNCIKCGGKTMNPPTTPYGGYPTTPQRSSAAAPQHRQPTTVSPPHTGGRPHGGWPGPPPGRYDPHDPRHDPRYDPRQDPRNDPRNDPRARYPPHGNEGPDSKRRRFDGNGVYVPTREYREGPSYPYSPRGSYYRTEMPAEPTHRLSMSNGPRPIYLQQSNPPQPGPAVRTQFPQQPQRGPGFILPPIKTPTSKPINTQLSAVERNQSSGIEAMIMSIQVLNKLKTLGTIAPPLAAPSAVSPLPEVRGAIVAVECMDPTMLNSMINSLAEEIERDGKFAVRIFGGPDPYATSGEIGQRRASKSLTYTDYLTLIGEWHKISDEMRQYITSRPERDNDGDTAMANSEPEKKVSEDIGISPSLVSPRNITTKTKDLSLEPIPEPRRLSKFSFQQNRSDGDEETQYTRIPAAAIRSATVSRQLRPKSSPTADKPLDVLPPSKDETVKSVEFAGEEASVDQTVPTPIERSDLVSTKDDNATVHTAASAVSSRTSTASTTSRNGPIPIALVPHYSLTTVDTTSIAMPIRDSYSPLAHWQWLATLWRGCVGADVTVVVRNAGSVDAEESPVAGKLDSNGSDGAAKKLPPALNQPLTLPGPIAQGSKERNVSIATSSTGGSSAPGSMSAPSNKGPGVEVRLLDCRAVIVTMAEKKTAGKSVDGEEAEKETEREKDRDRERDEFWEKAKRRVGFEVGSS